MAKEKMKKASAVLIVVAFVLGLIIGYFANDITKTETVYQFEEGDNILKNSGFENEIEDNPAYWFRAYIPADNLTMTWDEETSYTGSKCIYIESTHIYDETVCNNWAQTINLIPLDRTVELTGWVKTIEAESVVMVIQCWDENREMVGFGSTQAKTNITGTTDWNMYTASVHIPIETESIIVRLALTGTGQVWFDDVTLVIK